jgi:predicted nucleic acid-binding protein
MTRVVADTNIYISALMFGGLPAVLLDLGLIQGHHARDLTPAPG